MSVCANTGELKRSCTCRSCLGRRNRGKGKRKQRELRKRLVRWGLLDADDNSIRTGNEETWTGLVRVEVKAGAQIQSIVNRYEKARGQDSREDPRPFLLAVMPDGSSRALFILSEEDLFSLYLMEMDPELRQELLTETIMKSAQAYMAELVDPPIQ